MATSYVVQAGDTWRSIAAAQLGNASLGPALAGRNGSNLGADPIAGAVIALDIDAGSAAIGGAVIRALRQRFTFADFGAVPNPANGIARFDDELPAGAIVLAADFDVEELFAGDSAHLGVNWEVPGIGTDDDRVLRCANDGGEIDSAAAPVGLYSALASSVGLAPVVVDTPVTAVVVTTVSIANLVAGAVTVTVYYLPTR